MATSKDALKLYFQTGDRPTESQFSELIDSYIHVDGPEINRLIENVNIENGNLVFKGKNGQVVTLISLEDIKNNMNLAASMQNMATADLTNTIARIFTQAAAYTWNTANQAFYFKNLLDKSADSNFNRFLVQDINGQFVYSDAIKALTKNLQSATSTDRTAFLSALSSQYSSAQISVTSVYPPVIKYENVNKYFVMQGLNLNINPTESSVKFVNQTTQQEYDCISFQAASDGKTLTVLVNGQTLPNGIYKIKIVSSGKLFITNQTIEVLTNINYVDFSNLQWTETNVDGLDNTKALFSGKYGTYRHSTTVAFSTSTTPSDEPIFKTKSGKIFNSNDNFVIVFTLSHAYNNTAGSNYSMSKTMVGLSPNNSNSGLVNDIIAGVSVQNIQTTNKTKVWNIYGFSYTTGFTHIASPSLKEVIIIKKGNVLTIFFDNISDTKTINDNNDFSITYVNPNRMDFQEYTEFIIKEAYTF